MYTNSLIPMLCVDKLCTYIIYYVYKLLYSYVHLYVKLHYKYKII